MPIYEYACEKCGTFEVSQKMSDPALTTHEPCGSKVERLISLSSFSLKGGGWYSDGYASKKSASSGGCGSGACGAGGCGAASA